MKEINFGKGNKYTEICNKKSVHNALIKKDLKDLIKVFNVKRFSKE